MPAAVQHYRASRSKHFAITIPATGGTAVTVISLATGAGLAASELSQVIGGRISAIGTTYGVGDTVASQPWVVPVNTEFEELACDWLNSFVKSTAGALNVSLIVYLAGDPMSGATA